MKLHWPLYISMALECVKLKWQSHHVVKQIWVKCSDFQKVFARSICLTPYFENTNVGVASKSDLVLYYGINGHLNKCRWSDFYKTSRNGFFCHREVHINTKINEMGCKTKYFTPIANFMTPTDPPCCLNRLFDWLCLIFWPIFIKMMSNCPGDHTASNKTYVP